MIPPLKDGNVDPVPQKLKYKYQCPICHQFIKLRDDGKLKRHAKLGRSSKNIRHKCGGTYLLVTKETR